MSTSVLTRDVSAVQRRTLAVLILAQVIGGMGVTLGITMGALLAASLGGTAISGLAGSALVVGAALLAVPATRIMRATGRRSGLVFAFAAGAVGALIVVLGATRDSLPLVFAGLFLFGGGSAANLQTRYAAVDLAEPASRGRQLSLVVWAATFGAVAGPQLAPIANRLMSGLGAAEYSGPFLFSAVAFVLAGIVTFVLLRPDPLMLARELSAASVPPPSGPPARAGLAAAVREVSASPAARLGVLAVAMGHVVMVGVMSMTPVHIGESGHADTVGIVAIVLSLHIAGMYAISPVTGYLTDKVGRRPVILGGIALLVAACVVAGTAGHDTARLSMGLVLLGLGWSGTMVAGSTLLSESVAVANKPSVQGLSDLVMGLAGALAAALSGVIVAWSSFATLTILAAVATVPLIALALRPVRVPISVEEGV